MFPTVAQHLLLLLLAFIFEYNCQILLSHPTHKLQVVNSLVFIEDDRIFTEVIIQTGLPDVSQCNFFALTLSKEKLLAVVYFSNYNCTIIRAKSSVSYSYAEKTYTTGTIFVNSEYGKIIESVKPFKYPSSCITDTPLPASTYKLLQQRVDGCLLFNRTWTEYVNGFGHPTGNYWAGLELMHLLTWPNGNGIRFEMKKFSDNTLYYATYNSFKIGNSIDNYRLIISGYNAGQSNFDAELGDHSMLKHSNHQFSTPNHDNDGNTGNCAAFYGHVGWWFVNCHSVFGNAIWSDIRTDDGSKYIRWHPLDGNFALRLFRMLLIN